MLKQFIKISMLAFLAADVTAIFALSFINFQIRLPADSSNTEIETFNVEMGQGAMKIARELESMGIIKNSFYFNFYVWQSGNSKRLQAGEYEIAPSMSISQIADMIAKGEVKMRGIKVTIPEGYSTRQIENVLISSDVNIKKTELVEAVGISSDLAYEIFKLNFLKDLPSRATLDGFLFPDTYIFEEDAGLNDIVGKMLVNFDNKADEPFRIKIKANDKNLYEVIIMASLLEKEVKSFEDMKIVSGILWKRMKIGMPLQADATLAFLTGKKTGEITNEDKLIDSQFNTYKYRGLPPRPIANPGLNAIRAAAEPQDSDYLYYLSTPEGETIFSGTLEEHNENKAKHLK